MKHRICIVLLVLLAGSVLLAQDALTIYTSGNVGIRTDPQQDPGVPLKVQGKIQDRSGEVMPVGSILAFGGITPPAGWFLCNGDSKSISEFPDLYAVISTHFGPGENPPTSFSLPNLMGVSPTGVGSQAINSRTKTGPLLGEVREDRFQNITGSVNCLRSRLVSPTGAFGGSGSANGGGATYSSTMTEFTFDASGSTAEGGARTGAYTHGPEIGVNFIIKY